MSKLYLEATKYTPEVLLDSGEKLIKFVGKSYPENTFAFYEPIVDWLKEFFSSPKNAVKIEFDISYFNSSSSKLFFDLFDIFEDAVDDGSEIEIKWYYDAENDTAEEAGEDFKDDFEELNFILIEKSE